MLMGPRRFFEMPDGVIPRLASRALEPADAEFYGVNMATS